MRNLALVFAVEEVVVVGSVEAFLFGLIHEYLLAFDLSDLCAQADKDLLGFYGV